MKNTLKRFIAAFSAFFIFCSSFLSSVFIVSADSLDNFFYQGNSSDLTFDYMKSCYDKLLSNPVFSNLSSGYAVYIHFFSSTKVRFQIFPSYSTVDDSSSYRTYIYYVPFDSQHNIIPYYCAECPVSYLSNYPFTILDTVDQYSYFVLIKNSDLSDSGYCAYSRNSYFDGSIPQPGFSYNGNCISFVSPSISSPDEPDHTTSYPLFWGVRIGIEKKSFLDWLRSEGKLSLINSPGFDFVDSQLDTLIDIFDSYGNNPFSFLSSLCKTFNITTDIKAAVSLVQTIQQLYRDYQDYKNSSQLEAIRPSSNSLPHHRTDKDDVSLTTDHEDDTTLISILREILRTLIHLPEDISVYFNFLNSRFNDISYNFQSEINSLNNLPDQISSSTYNNLINPLTEIKDAINNIDVSSPDVSVDVTISDEKQNEINTFFSDWNVKYSTAINEKIPVISQLSGLFNDEFFEKCGIDTNGDGQVYQYYSTSVSYDSSFLSGTSSDSVSDNDDFVNLLCSQFDNSDPNFLDDVSYSEDVPSLSISIGGKKTEIFDFRLFAKYRTQIHTIMIFCIYSLYFLSLYKSLPSIIGNVSDVTNAFSDYKQSKKE